MDARKTNFKANPYTETLSGKLNVNGHELTYIIKALTAGEVAKFTPELLKAINTHFTPAYMKQEDNDVTFATVIVDLLSVAAQVKDGEIVVPVEDLPVEVVASLTEEFQPALPALCRRKRKPENTCLYKYGSGYNYNSAQ